MCRVTDAWGTSHHAYDVFGNLVQQRIVEAGIDRSHAYDYDGEDRLSAITTAAGKALALVRDTEGRANRALAVVNASATALVQSTSYRGDGRAELTQLGNNVSLDRGFDSSGAPAGAPICWPRSYGPAHHETSYEGSLLASSRSTA